MARLGKVSQEFNTGMDRIVEFLQHKGFNVENNPCSKITDEMYALLLMEFSDEPFLEARRIPILPWLGEEFTTSAQANRRILNEYHWDDLSEDKIVKTKTHLILIPKNQTCSNFLCWELNEVEQRLNSLGKDLYSALLNDLGPATGRIMVEPLAESNVTRRLSSNGLAKNESGKTMYEYSNVPPLSSVKVISKIDLDEINQRTRPVKKTHKEKEEERRERLLLQQIKVARPEAPAQEVELQHTEQEQNAGVTILNEEQKTEIEKNKEQVKSENDEQVIVTNETSKSEKESQNKYYMLLLDVIESYERCSPEKITSLSKNQIFVFGTDTRGSQRYGAAGLASKNFGAIAGVSCGPTGNSYALPTKGFQFSDLKKAVQQFEVYVRRNKQLEFFVTAVGCGNAGFEVKSVAPLFQNMVALKNVRLPQTFIDFYKQECERVLKCNQQEAIETKKEVLIEKESETEIRETKNQEQKVELIQKIIVENETSNDKKQVSPESQKVENTIKTEESVNDEVLQYFDKQLHEVVNYLLENNIPFNKEGGFSLENENGKIIAEADLCIESEKIIINPFNSQSEMAFKRKGYKIYDPEMYLSEKMG